MRTLLYLAGVSAAVIVAELLYDHYRDKTVYIYPDGSMK